MSATYPIPAEPRQPLRPSAIERNSKVLRYQLALAVPCILRCVAGNRVWEAAIGRLTATAIERLRESLPKRWPLTTKAGKPEPFDKGEKAGEGPLFGAVPALSGHT